MDQFVEMDGVLEELGVEDRATGAAAAKAEVAATIGESTTGTAEEELLREMDMNDRIIAVDFQSAYKKVKCLNKTYNSLSIMVCEETCANGKTLLVFVNEVVKINPEY
uniref:Uncharacterized protein n=1 Tax=Caenorhabditis japonica TaxID=281687 RepID=A0A8R1EC46_CAEJA